MRRTSLEQTILRGIRSSRMLSPGDRVGVAVSGGGDSVALLRVLQSIRGQLGIMLSVVHFDHALRGDESEMDAQFVAELARRLSLEFILERANVAEEARRNGWNLEDAARRLRYGFFQRVVDEDRATHIAVAHTADDQAETVLAHLVRGTGPTGLAGIYPIAGSIIRPLLGIRRRELREYLERLGQAWREDSTNSDPARLRARIRAGLMPEFEAHFSPRIVEHLCQLARFSREEQAFWSAFVEDRYRALVREEDGALRLQASDLLDPFRSSGTVSGQGALKCSSEQWLPLTERLIRRLCRELLGHRREVTSDHVQQVIRLATDSASGRYIRLSTGIVVERTFGHLSFRMLSRGGAKAQETIQRSPAYHYVVPFSAADKPLDAGPTSVAVPELGVCFHLKLVDWAGTESETKDDCRVLDAESLRPPLILRNWRPGDAYTPYGRRQPRKLKQMFLAARVPLGARREWPVLESAGRVIWARGLPPADAFCAHKRTRIGLVIEESKL